MDSTCKLRSKCLKVDENLEKCQDPDCDKMLWDCQRFKTLAGKEEAVEVKNDLVLMGTLHSVDQYSNVKLTNVTVVDSNKYPQMLMLQNCFIWGSVVRYIQLPPEEVDTELPQDMAIKENAPKSKAIKENAPQAKVSA